MIDRWFEDFQLNLGRGLLSIWRAFVPHPGDHYARIADELRAGPVIEPHERNLVLSPLQITELTDNQRRIYTGAGTDRGILMEHAVAGLVYMIRTQPSMHDLLPRQRMGMIIEIEGYQVEV